MHRDVYGGQFTQIMNEVKKIIKKVLFNEEKYNHIVIDMVIYVCC